MSLNRSSSKTLTAAAQAPFAADQPWSSCVQERATRRLYQAILDQDSKAVMVALESGANVNTPLNGRSQPPMDNVPRTLLSLAVEKAVLPDDVPNEDVVELLLLNGADPDPCMVAWFRDNDDHPACEALQRSVLDRLAQGRPVPHTVVARAMREQWDVEHPLAEFPSVLPASGQHRHLWLHRAIEFDHVSAFKAWFDHGGVIGVNGNNSESAPALLWGQWMNDANAVCASKWSAMIDLLTPQLLNEPSDRVYRKEVMLTLCRYAQAHRHFKPEDPVLTRCMAWVQALVHERALHVHTLSEEEALELHLTIGSTPHSVVMTSLQRLEQYSLRNSLNMIVSDRVSPLPSRARL